MKKSIWLAIIGAAALTGCQSEVMQQREYIPAPRDDSEARAMQTADPAPAPEVVQPRQETQPVVQELPTMTQTFSDEGITDDRSAGKGKGKGKGAKEGAKDGEAAQGGEKSGSRIYIVKRGDFPERIARKHRISVQALMDANNLTIESAKKLQIGQKLVIPEPDGTAGSGKGKGKGKGRGKGKNIGSEAPAGGSNVYIVKSGDSPEKIARRHHVRVAALMEANNLSEDDAKKLQIGQKLVIPERGSKGSARGGRRGGGSAAAQQGEHQSGGVRMVDVPDDMSIEEFAQRNHTTAEKLREINYYIPEQLSKGNSYIVPAN